MPLIDDSDELVETIHEPVVSRQWNAAPYSFSLWERVGVRAGV